MSQPAPTDLTAPLGDLDMYIDGAWVSAASGKRMDVVNPATGQSVGTVPEGGREDAQRAIAAAAAAEETLRWMTAHERSAMCKRVVASLERHRDALARAITLDQGKPYLKEGKWEAGACQHFYAEASEDILRLHGETIPSSDRNKRVVTYWQSRGPYAVVTPWNFPYNIPSEYISACLAAGNPVVWVPAPTTSGCSAVLARAIVEADLPRGAFNFVTGLGAVVGDEIVSHPATRGIGFTGSPVTGQKIAERGAGKPMLLELGGNGPFVVLADADLDAAVEGIVFSAYFNSGQACSATERVLVAASVKDALLEKLLRRTAEVKLGDPFADDTTMGPLNNAAVAEKMDRHIADALARGARLVAGGRRGRGLGSDLFYEPTILDGVTPEMAVHREETFGPIVPITTFETNEEALRLANDNELGLISAVYTRNLKAAYWFGERIRTGIVNINETPNYWETPIPYGGINTIREVMDQRAILMDIEKGGF
jgi:acyl-CoA reductase-like NAD-dependent aldehyde dehydrogenase